MVNFAQLFDKSITNRDKFLARLLGLFSETIVRLWVQDSSCPYEDLGRPTITQLNTGKRFTFDFTLSIKSQGQSEQPKKKFITEMKCWPEFERYRYLNLATDQQLEKVNNGAFKVFLALAKQPEKFTR